MKNNSLEKIKSLIGVKFNKLTVISISSFVKSNSYQSILKCLCDCGNYKEVKVKCLLEEQTGSCGCLRFGIKSHNDPNMAKMSSAKVIYRDSYSDGNISFEDFIRLSQMSCFYCDSPPQNISNPFKNKKSSSIFSRENGNFIYNGLDRIDNAKPHDIENVVTCCKWCNYAKRERSFEEFKNWIIKINLKLGIK